MVLNCNYNDNKGSRYKGSGRLDTKNCTPLLIGNQAVHSRTQICSKSAVRLGECFSSVLDSVSVSSADHKWSDQLSQDQAQGVGHP